MKPPAHVLVPIDFSETSLRALNYGLYFTDAFSAELTLIHVLIEPTDEHAVKDTEQRLEALIPDPVRSRTHVHATAVDCPLEDELLRLVGESAADLVVLGTRGLRPFKRFLLGSTTDRLLRLLPVPVVTVCKRDESGETVSGTRPEVRRILYPTDFSDSKEIALPLAIEFARRFEAELELVHVVEHLRRSPTSPPYTDEELAAEQRGLRRSAEDSLQRIASAASIADVTVTVTVLEGRRPHDAILAHIADGHIDLVVLSLHGMTQIERVLLGATAERIIRAAPVPILGVPSSASLSGAPGNSESTKQG